MRRALLGDIHGNLEALTAVQEDIKEQKVDEILCLGDLVGYGPNPAECVDLAMSWRFVLRGDWEERMLSNESVDKFRRTRDALNAGDAGQVDARWRFLRNLPHALEVGDFLFVHGSPRRPLDEYVFPEDVYNPRKMERLFGLVKSTCFVGHTHLPGIFTEQGGFLSPPELNFQYHLGSGKTIVNIGSVGQPLDGDPRACYVLLEKRTVSFRRIDYDVGETERKLRDLR